jgi:hypothetical protein
MTDAMSSAYRGSDAVESDVASVLSNGQADSGVDSSKPHYAREDAVNSSTLASTPDTSTDPKSPFNAISATEESGSASSDKQGAWGGVDGVADSPTRDGETSDSSKRAHRRQGSATSHLNFESVKNGKGKGGGIRIGTAKPVRGIVTEASATSLPESGDEGSRR